MHTSNDDPNAPVVSLDDDLSQLEMQVAHRADELWRNEGQGRGSDLEFWLKAEREVVERRLAQSMLRHLI